MPDHYVDIGWWSTQTGPVRRTASTSLAPFFCFKIRIAMLHSLEMRPMGNGSVHGGGGRTALGAARLTERMGRLGRIDLEITRLGSGWRVQVVLGSACPQGEGENHHACEMGDYLHRLTPGEFGQCCGPPRIWSMRRSLLPQAAHINLSALFRRAPGVQKDCKAHPPRSRVWQHPMLPLIPSSASPSCEEKIRHCVSLNSDIDAPSKAT